MRCLFIFGLVVFLALVQLGSSTKCYACTALLSSSCVSGVHTSDPLFQIKECDGRCIKLDIPKEQTNNQPTTSKMCLPYTGLQNFGEAPLTVDSCNRLSYCHVCVGDLCNSADKITGVAVSMALGLCTLLFIL